MQTEFVPAIPQLKKLLPAFRKIRIAVLGDLMLDRYVWGTAHRLSPEAPVPVVDFESQGDFPGGAGNVAVNLAALGARVQVFGLVGGKKLTRDKVEDDEAGAAIRAWLLQAKIEERGVLPDTRRITTVKTRIVALNRQIVRVDHERRDMLALESEEKLYRLVVASLRNLDALLISDYDKGLVTDALAERILRACHKFGVPVFVKPKASRLIAYPGARAIVCNASEASFYVTRPLNDEKSLEEAGRALLAHFGCAGVVITQREKGMSIFEEDSPRYVSIPATSFEVSYAQVGQRAVQRQSSGRQVFDVTGAGDTVLSVLSLAVAAGARLPEAGYLANTAAGEVVQKLGTASVSPAELAAALDEIKR
jgi:D-beta-D-heptose 7-phosphate kinase / D-beta-D-heptose 1-phosphate adenosyltransferase